MWFNFPNNARAASFMKYCHMTGLTHGIYYLDIKAVDATRMKFHWGPFHIVGILETTFLVTSSVVIG